MSLQEWLDKLETFDPDNWGDLELLRARFSEEQLIADVEAEITFRTLAGTVDQVHIQLLDEDETALVDLNYEILQLDSVILSEFIMVSNIPASLEQRSVLEAAQRVDASQSLPAAWGKQGMVAYTDGACLSNPGGPAGWSALIWSESDVLSGKVRPRTCALASFGHIPQSPTTTNNRAEVSAVLAVLHVVPPELPLTIQSDSQYLINVAQGEWEMRKNADLWKWYHDLVAQRKTAPIFHWVQGHAGHHQNVLADQLAGIAAKNGSAAAYEYWQKLKESDPL